MTGAPEESEQVLEYAEQPQAVDLGAQLLQDFASGRIFSTLTEIDAAAQRPVEALMLHGVEAGRCQDAAVLSPEQHQCHRPDLARGPRLPRHQRRAFA